MAGGGFGRWRSYYAGHGGLVGTRKGVIVGQIGGSIGRRAGGIGVFFICGCLGRIYCIEAGWGADSAGGSGI